MADELTDNPIEETQDQAVASCEWIDQAVVFFLDGQRYGISLGSVQEIQQIVAFSDVPSRSVGVVGMVNMRGHVIPAVDMRQLVGLPRAEYTLETPMIICRMRGQLVALIVDEVQDVLDLPEGCLQAAPPMHDLSSKMVGVARMVDGLVYVLDVELLLAGLLSSGGW